MSAPAPRPRVSPPLIAAEGATRTLPGPVPVTLVRDVTLAVNPGDLIAITGPSGSGKSSLLYLLGLLDKPSAGRVLVDGTDTSTLSGDALSDLRLARLGFVFQFHFLLPEFTALDNVLIPMRKLDALDEPGRRARAEGILGQLDLADQAHKRPDQMSGGQRQRVAVARALANDPAVLLADEPTGNLDTRNARAVFDIFRDLALGRGKAVVVVTHEVELAKLATRRVHLVDGRIVGDG